MSEHWTGHQYEDADNRSLPIGHGNGSDDERDNIILFDSRDKGVVFKRYRPKVGFRGYDS